MEQNAVREKLVADFGTLPEQLQQAARYVLDRPRDVALLSMREQARQAGVRPATMTRLAQRIGLDGYEPVRQAYAAALRGGATQGFRTKAGEQVERQKKAGDRSLAAEMLERSAAQMGELAAGDMPDRLEHAARMLAGARRVFCLGLRSSHAVAWQLHYILSMVGDRSVMLDAPGGTGADLVGRIGSADVMLAVSVAPYTRVTVELARQACARGAALVALTDSDVSPLARLASEVVLVPTESASFLHTMAPAFVIAEIIGALVAGRGGTAALEAIQAFDAQAAALGVHIGPDSRRKGFPG